MNQRKIRLTLLLVLTVLFSFCSVYSANVFAALEGPENGSSAQKDDKVSSKTPGDVSDVPVQGEAGGTASEESPSVSSVPSAPSSAKPPVSSRPASSRKPKKKKASSVPSSAVFSEASSALLRSEEPSSAIVLPSVGSIAEDNPLSSAEPSSGAQRKTALIGMLSWACIALGILVVIIVLLSNRRPPRGPGRKRYRRRKRSKKKRLLNDRYYRGLNRY